jgi:hypothetical protein
VFDFRLEETADFRQVVYGLLTEGEASRLVNTYFAFMAGMFLLDATTVYSLSRPRRTGFYVALSALAVSLIENIVSIALALSDLEGVEEVYAESRETRGLPVSLESLDLIFSPQVIYGILAALLALYSAVAFLILRNRRYFFGNAETSRS